MARPRVGIGLPLIALRRGPLIALCQNLIQSHAEMVLLIVEGAYIQHNRAQLVKHAREEGCSHLFFMDHDMVFPADTVDRLLAHDKDIVGAAYNIRGLLPLQTAVILRDTAGEKVPREQLPTHLFECEATPCGVMLLKVPIFEQMPWPWFDIEVGPPPECNLLTSEDVWFCDQARKGGFQIFCDPTIPVLHMGEIGY